MKRVLTAIGQYLAATLLVALGLSFFGCSDSVSISEDVAVPLSSLTVTPGTLQPGFFANTTNYGVNAPTSADSVTVTAVPKDNTTIMTINGTLTAAGQGRSVTLGAPGSTTIITIVLESQNGTESTYTVTVTRLLSSDNNLSALDVTPGNLNPPFDPDIEDYTVNVGVLVERVDVEALKSDRNAEMVISWATGSVTIGAGDNRPGQAKIPLGGPGSATPVSIEVTAPNGNKKTYRITVNRAPLSGDNNLSDLMVSVDNVDQALNPMFASGTLNYTVGVATEVTEVIVRATKSDPDAVMQIHSVTVPAGTESGQDTVPLNGPGADTIVSIDVTAPNGTPNPYRVTVRRAIPAAPPAPTVAPDLISEDDSCLLIPTTNICDPLSGTTREDNITNVTTPRFRIPQPGASETPSLYVDGAKVDAIFDQLASTLKPTAALNDGERAITSTVTNIATTLESLPSPSLTVTIDTRSPLPL
jgi:hypothetical protein